MRCKCTSKELANYVFIKNQNEHASEKAVKSTKEIVSLIANSPVNEQDCAHCFFQKDNPDEKVTTEQVEKWT
jgi:hypothetical protein